MKNFRGAGLIEVLIASALVFFFALIIAFMATNSKKVSKNTHESAACRERSQFVVDVFKRADNKLQMSNFHSTAAVPLPTAPFSHLERFGYPLANPTPGADMTYDQTNGWELIDNGTNWALALYNNTSAGVNFCSTPFVASAANQITPSAAPGGFAAWGPPNPLFPPGTPLLNEKIYLNIQRYDYATSSATCLNQGSQRIVPQGILNASSPDSKLGVNVGMQVTSVVQYTDLDGTPMQCSSTVTVRPEGDIAAPTFAPVPSDVLPWGSCPGSNCFCSINNLCVSNVFPGQLIVAVPNRYCGVNKVTVSVASNEPGTVFGCELDYSANLGTLRLNPIPLFLPCRSFSSTGVTGVISAFHSVWDTTTGVEIDLTGLTDGYYNIFIQAYDSAQNTQVQSAIFQYKTTCP